MARKTMLDPTHFEIVAGERVVEELRAQQEAIIPWTGYGYASDNLCALQRTWDERGIRGAQLTQSIYGWSVRADSGLQDFALLAGKRMGNVDGTLEGAVAWARAWAARDPKRRYVWKRRDM